MGKQCLSKRREEKIHEEVEKTNLTSSISDFEWLFRIQIPLLSLSERWTRIQPIAGVSERKLFKWNDIPSLQVWGMAILKHDCDKFSVIIREL